MKEGRVFLVGAGPGNPELMTVKACRLLQEADVVVYDRLVSDAILNVVPRGATKIDVGKQPHHHPVPQEDINETLVRLAKSGRTVIRLKGGDPFLFGRGGEEALALAAAGIQFEVVPGITSAQGCAASLKLPLTHRKFAKGIRFITGHCHADSGIEFDWDGLADPQTTLVVYMGLANIGEITSRLIDHGRDPKTPVLAISRGTLPDERHITSTLANICIDLQAAVLPSPTLFIIGEVVRLASILGTFRHDMHPEQLAVSP